MAIQYFKIEPKIIGQSLKTGVKIIADDPKTVGADIICDVAGIYNNTNEAIIIDLGTATKYIYTKNRVSNSAAKVHLFY